MRPAAYDAEPTGLTLVDAPEASFMPRALLGLATFGRSDRELINGDSDLRAAVRAADPSQWTDLLQAHRRREAARIAERCADWQDDAEGMRAQALYDLNVASQEFASLHDGRRERLFSLVCRLARYERNGILTEAEVTSVMLDAARANGALTAHGVGWARGVIKRALNHGQNDKLPPLARRFRSEADA